MRGDNRRPGAPALPGAGRPPRSTMLRVGDRVGLKIDGGPIAEGVIVGVRRNGTLRTTTIQMTDGSTAFLLAETPAMPAS